MKYYIHYVSDSTPIIKTFSSKTSLNRFIKGFKQDPYNGYWIDFTFYGRIGNVDEYYEDYLPKKRKKK